MRYLKIMQNLFLFVIIAYYGTIKSLYDAIYFHSHDIWGSKLLTDFNIICL